MLLEIMEKEKLIMDKLDLIRSEIDSLKEYLIDFALTADDLNSIEEAEKELLEGKTTSLADLKKELRM